MAVIKASTPVKPDLLKKVSRRKLAIAITVLLAEVALCTTQILLGVWVHITVENISAGTFWASVLLFVGALVSLEGIFFDYGRQKILAMGIMLQIVGVFMALVGGLIESVVASLIRGVDFSRCSYSSSGLANCTAELSCDAVQLSYPRSCYCCFLTKERMSPCYFRAVSLFEAPSIYAGVDSCSQVPGAFLNLLWMSVFFCAACCLFGLIAAICTYSYRSIIKPQIPSFAITAVTSPMLPIENQSDKSEQSGTLSISDIPTPAPRNSLMRSSSHTGVSEASSSKTSYKASSLPGRQKRRAPDIPGRSDTTTQSCPSSVQVSPVRQNTTRSSQLKPSSGKTQQQQNRDPKPPEQRDGPSDDSPKSTDAAPNSTESRPTCRSTVVRPKSFTPEQSERVNRSSSTGARESLSPSSSYPNLSERHKERRRLSPDSASARRSSPGAEAASTKDDAKAGAKKRKSHKGPAPLPPVQAQTSQMQLRPLPRLDPMPEVRSPPPPFAPNPPPSPPPFMPSPAMHYQQQPVTNIHVTLTTSPMGANIHMPSATPQAYMFHGQPTAPCL